MKILAVWTYTIALCGLARAEEVFLLEVTHGDQSSIGSRWTVDDSSIVNQVRRKDAQGGNTRGR